MTQSFNFNSSLFSSNCCSDFGLIINRRYKLFIGSIAQVLWKVTGGQLAAQTEYVIDGVEEAVGELICGIKQTKIFKEAIGKYNPTDNKEEMIVEEIEDEIPNSRSDTVKVLE